MTMRRTITNARIAAAAQVGRAEQYALAVAQLNSLYAAAVRLQDYRTALSVRRDLTALLRLSPPTPAESVTLDSPAAVLRVVEAELNAVLSGNTSPERTRAIETLTTAAIKAIEVTDLAERITLLEERINHE